MTTLKVFVGCIIVAFAAIGFEAVFGNPFAPATGPNVSQGSTMTFALPPAIGDWFSFMCYFTPISAAFVAVLIVARPMLMEALTGFINRHRPVNGVLPVVVKKVNGAEIHVNQNTMVRSAFAITEQGEYFELDGGTPDDHNLAATLSHQRFVAAPSTMFPSDDALKRMAATGNVIDSLGNAGLHGMKTLLAGKSSDLDGNGRPRITVTSTARPVEQAPAALIPVREWSAAEAFATAKPTLLPIGPAYYTDKEGFPSEPTGELVYWDMKLHPHLRAHGKSQTSGKTNVIKQLAALAMMQGAHLIVLDRRLFKDWGDFQGKAEMHDVRDPEDFQLATSRLYDIHTEREAELGRMKAPNIDALATPPQRLVIVISEFGALCDDAFQAGVLRPITARLTTMLRMAATAGLHFLIEDQFVDSDRWPKGIATNAEPLVGYLPPGQGAKAGWASAHKLGAGAYNFFLDHEIASTYNMQVEAPRLLANVPPCQPMIDMTRQAPAPQEAVPPPATAQVPPAGEAQVQPTGEALMQLTAAQRREAKALGFNVDSPHRFDDLIVEWFAEVPERIFAVDKQGNPNGEGSSEVAGLMAAMENEILSLPPEQGRTAGHFKGLAHKKLVAFRSEMRFKKTPTN